MKPLRRWEDRLLRFGAELVFAICEAKQVEVVILNQGSRSDASPAQQGMDAMPVERKALAVVERRR